MTASPLAARRGAGGEAPEAVMWAVHAVTSSEETADLSTVSESGERDGVRLVVRGGLAAVVSPFPAGLLAVAGEPAQGAEAESPESEELALAACRHEGVVEAVLGQVDVVPFRFGTLLRSLDDVERLLDRDADRLRASLEAVAGCVEWSVELHAARRAPEVAAEEPKVEAAGSSSPGRDYLLRRKRQLATAAKASEMRANWARDVVARLGPLCRSTADLGATRPAVPVGGAEKADVVLGRLACLVERRAESAFFEGLESALATVGGGAVQADVTGPWPAYHFVSDGRDGGRAPEGER